MISDFIKKISPQVGLEPTKMRQDLKKSVSFLPEGEEKILSFRCDFSWQDKCQQNEINLAENSLTHAAIIANINGHYDLQDSRV